MKKGKLFLVPTLLGGETANDLIPQDVQQQTCALRYFAVEDLKSARRYLRKLDRNFPIDDSTFVVLNKRSKASDTEPVIAALQLGTDVGIISEAGCPGIADPGALLVSEAHHNGIRVAPLVGPSSILLALMGSGFSGQEFTFHGYLPKDRKDRVRKLRDLEADTRRTGFTHIFMDTPFRNMNVLDDLLNELNDQTALCIASNLTLPSESVWSMSVKDWREKAYDLAKQPCIFIIGNFQ